MKLRIYSDLHLEFSDFDVPVVGNEKDQILILAGDIGVVSKKYTMQYFLEEMNDRFHAVLCVVGNHEYYGSSCVKTRKKFYEMTQDLPNVRLLDDEHVTIGDITFVGSTLWTDMDNENPVVMADAKLWMNDYKHIRTGTTEAPYFRKLNPFDTVEKNKKTREYIKEVLDIYLSKKIVVITHHAPTELSVHEKYKGNTLNGAYVNNMFDDLYDSNIALWIHGHTHYSFDYDVNGTRVVCNPRGYVPFEVNPNFDPNGLLIEV